MAVEAGITSLLFAPPSIRADAGDGSVLLRSTEPLGDYPVTVVHSVRAWAAGDPGHPAPPGVIVAEGTCAGGAKSLLPPPACRGGGRPR
jgi:hypothetical protein